MGLVRKVFCFIMICISLFGRALLHEYLVVTSSSSEGTSSSVTSRGKPATRPVGKSYTNQYVLPFFSTASVKGAATKRGKPNSNADTVRFSNPTEFLRPAMESVVGAITSITSQQQQSSSSSKTVIDRSSNVPPSKQREQLAAEQEKEAAASRSSGGGRVTQASIDAAGLGSKEFFLHDAIYSLFSMTTALTSKDQWIESLYLMFLPGSSYQAIVSDSSESQIDDTATGTRGRDKAAKNPSTDEDKVTFFTRRDLASATGNGFVHPLYLDLLRSLGYLFGGSENHPPYTNPLERDTMPAEESLMLLIPVAETFLILLVPFITSCCLLGIMFTFPDDVLDPSDVLNRALGGRQHARRRAGARASTAVKAQENEVFAASFKFLSLPIVVVCLWFLNPLFMVQSVSLDLAAVEQMLVSVSIYCLLKGTAGSVQTNEGRQREHELRFILRKPSPQDYPDLYGLELPSDKKKDNEKEEEEQEKLLKHLILPPLGPHKPQFPSWMFPMWKRYTTEGEKRLPDSKLKKMDAEFDSRRSYVHLFLGIVCLIILVLLHPPRIATFIGLLIVVRSGERLGIITVTGFFVFQAVAATILLLGKLHDSMPVLHYLQAYAHHYSAQLFLAAGYPMGEPTISLQWYMFQTLFVEYSTLYSVAFRMIPIVFTVAVAIKVRHLVPMRPSEVKRELNRAVRLESRVRTNKIPAPEGGLRNGVIKQLPYLDVPATKAILALSNLFVVLAKPALALPEFFFALLLTIILTYPLMIGIASKFRRIIDIEDEELEQQAIELGKKRKERLQSEEEKEAGSEATKERNEEGVTSSEDLKAEEKKPESSSGDKKSEDTTKKPERSSGVSDLVAIALMSNIAVVPMLHAFYFAWLVQQVANPNFLFFSCAVLQGMGWTVSVEVARAVIKQGRV